MSIKTGKLSLETDLFDIDISSVNTKTRYIKMLMLRFNVE